MQDEDKSQGLSVEELQKQKIEIITLFRSVRAILKHQKFKDAAREIFDLCKNLIGATFGYVALLNKDGINNESLFFDSGGRPCFVDPSLPMPVRGLREIAYSTGKAVYQNDFWKSEWVKYMPEGHMKLDNIFFAPLVIKGKVVGLLGLANKPGNLTEYDALTASVFSEVAAVTLHNSGTFELLKNSEERFRSVAQSATDGIVCSDGFGNITFWNKAAALIFGYPADEALGKPLTFIMPERFRAIHQTGLNQVVFTGNSNCIGETFEVVGLRKDNSEFPLELSLATWCTEEGTFFTGIIRDIGERKRVEEELRASEYNYRTIFDAVNDAIFVHDIKTGDILDINRKACEMYGYTSEEARWLNVEDLSAGKAHYNQEYATQLINKAVMGEPQLFEWRAKNKSGILFWVEVNLKRVVIGGKFRLLAVVRDITERKRAEDAIKESKEFFEKVVNTAKALIVGLDISGKIVLFNAHCEDVTGWKREEAIGKHWLTNFVPSQYWSQLGHVCKKTVELGDGKEYEYPVVTKSGEERMVAWNNTILLDASGEISLVTCTGIDITERKLAQDMLQRLSSIDGLTGIANRRYFDQYLEREWRRAVRSSTPFSLVMCDIDYFKAYNDTYGHQGGDDCLKKVAAAIKSTLKRPGDLIARYGGEEFVIVMPETNVNGAAVLAEALRAGVEALGIAHANSQVNKCVTISLGVATIVPSLDSSPEELISLADKALYRAKQEGRNRIKLFRP